MVFTHLHVVNDQRCMKALNGRMDYKCCRFSRAIKIVVCDCTSAVICSFARIVSLLPLGTLLRTHRQKINIAVLATAKLQDDVYNTIALILWNERRPVAERGLEKGFQALFDVVLVRAIATLLARCARKLTKD